MTRNHKYVEYVDEKRKNSKSVRVIDYRMSVAILIAILSLTIAILRYAEAVYGSQYENKTVQEDIRKEYVIDIKKEGTLFWCGRNELALAAKKEKNIEGITFYNHDLEIVGTEDIAAGNGHYRGYACSNDGKYIYFIKSTKIQKERKVETFRELVIYDRKNKKMNTLIAYGTGTNVNHSNRLISPTRKYFIGPPGYCKLLLPGISNANLIDIDDLVGELPKNKTKISWDYLDRRLYLLDLDAQNIHVVDPKTSQRKTIHIKLEKNYEAYEAIPVKSLNKVIIVAYRMADEETRENRAMQTNIYVYDLENKMATLFVEDVDSFVTLNPEEGKYLCKKTRGSRSFYDGVYFDKDPMKRFKVITLIDENGKERILKKIFFGTTPGYFSSFSAAPVVSDDSSMIAFITEEQKKGHVKIQLHLMKMK